MERFEAIGLIETFGLVFVLEAADAMCKAADVELIGYENVASGYISVLVQGDVGACKTAVESRSKGSRGNGSRSLQLRSDCKTTSGSWKDHQPLFTEKPSSTGIMDEVKERKHCR